MNQKRKGGYLPAIVLFLAFILFTILVSVVDVQAIGPEGSKVGFAALNNGIFQALGQSEFWYTLTKIIGVVAIVVAVLFAIIGVLQLLQRKKVARVDGSIVALGITYVLLAICYVIFEFVVINQRPVLIDGQLEASYPSSHTMLVVCIMATAMMLFHTHILNKKFRMGLEVVCGVLIVLMVVGRLLSGVHWATDVIGGVLLGSALSAFYYGLANSLNRSRIRQRKER